LAPLVRRGQDHATPPAGYPAPFRDKRLGFIGWQILLLHPVAAVVWVAGLVHFVATPEGRTHRALGLAWLIALLVLI